MAASRVLIAWGLTAGLGWLAFALVAPRVPRRARRTAAIAAVALSAALGVAWTRCGWTPIGAPGPTLAVLGLGVGAWAVPALGDRRAFQPLALVAVALTSAAELLTLAAPEAPGGTAAARSWLLLSDAALSLATGSIVAAALRPGATEGESVADLPARAALGLGIAGLLAYGVGAQGALGAYAPGTPTMSHRLAAVLAIALVTLDGGGRRAPRLAAGLLCVAALLAQAPLSAWLHPEGMVIYP